MAQITSLQGQVKSLELEIAILRVQAPPFLPQSSQRSSKLPSLANVTVFSINEYINSPSMLALGGEFDSQMLVRAWFKWEWARDYDKESYLIGLAHSNGQLFGGGVTVSALYSDENNIPADLFNDIVTRDPFGNLYPAFGRSDSGYYHGAMANPRYLDYVLSFAYKQIDAGVDFLFMDEVNGAYGLHEGYDEYGIMDFRNWLLRAYCDQRGWSVTDSRWVQEFRVPFNDSAICPDGTMQTFDYAKYLQHYGWASDPGNSDNPFLPLWGDPGGITGDDYSSYRNNAAWAYLTTQIRSYAEGRGKSVLITANGLNKFVDFQMRGVWNDWVLKDGRLDCSANLLYVWRSSVERSRELLGRYVPLVLFHDWGFGFPWKDLNFLDKVNWLRVYVAEIYAAGGHFAFPVSGMGSTQTAKDDGTTAWISYLTQFYLNHSDLYHNRTWLSPTDVHILGDSQAQEYYGGVSVAFWQQTDRKRLIVHLINHHFQDQILMPQRGLIINMSSDERPLRVFAVSPSFKGEEELEYGMEGNNIQIDVPELDDYMIVIVQYEQLPTLVHYVDKIIYCNTEWRRPVANRFSVPNSLDSPQNASEILAYVQGNLHPDLRNNPTFVVKYPADGEFILHVDSVASGGAKLVVYMDGLKALESGLPDKDGSNNAFTHEYDVDFAIHVPAGQHEIRVDNPGSDWFSVNYYLLSHYLPSDQTQEP